MRAHLYYTYIWMLYMYNSNLIFTRLPSLDDNVLLKSALQAPNFSVSLSVCALHFYFYDANYHHRHTTPTHAKCVWCT